MSYEDWARERLDDQIDLMGKQIAAQKGLIASQQRQIAILEKWVAELRADYEVMTAIAKRSVASHRETIAKVDSWLLEPGGDAA